MRWSRNVASSSSKGMLIYRFAGSARGRNPRRGSRLGLAAAYQLRQFLRRRLIAAAKVAVLLRHGDANPRALLAQRLLFADP